MRVSLLLVAAAASSSVVAPRQIPAEMGATPVEVGATPMEAVEALAADALAPGLDLLANFIQREMQQVKVDGSETKTTYTMIETERRQLFMWTGILLAITTYMGVMAFFNMPLKKDPLLYTKFYSSGTH